MHSEAPAFAQSTDRSILLVFNPTAGRGRARRTAAAVLAKLKRRNIQVGVQATDGHGHAERIAAEAIETHRGDGELCIVACGGDGTMQEVANAVAKAQSPRVVMGLAPAGRCNDFAHALGVGVDPIQIARILAGGHLLDVDLGRVGERFFCTISALGFDGAVSRFVNDSKMPLHGAPAYVYGTLRELLRYRTPTLRLTGDFGGYEGPVFMAAGANTPRYGGAMRIAPQADPTDGHLDICLVSRITRPRVLLMLRKVVSGGHVGLDEVRMLRTKQFSVERCDGHSPVEIWADGEPVGQLPATIECVPGAIRVLTPGEWIAAPIGGSDRD